MTKMKKHASKVLLVGIIVLALILLPSALTQKAEGHNSLIVTAVGLDFKNDQWSVSIQYITPVGLADIKKNVAIISEEDTSFADAFLKLSLKAGKDLALEHATILVISEGSKEQNLHNAVFWLNKNLRLPLSAKLLYTENSSFETLEQINELDQNGTLSQNMVLEYNKKTNGGTKGATVYDILSNPNKIHAIPIFKEPQRVMLV
ncbi:MAG: hypothetical protein FWD89_03595 [Firmicutes bacterium]|nr:hypothetical protein [Bacillota bacterium]